MNTNRLGNLKNYYFKYMFQSLRLWFQEYGVEKSEWTWDRPNQYQSVICILNSVSIPFITTEVKLSQETIMIKTYYCIKIRK